MQEVWLRELVKGELFPDKKPPTVCGCCKKNGEALYSARPVWGEDWVTCLRCLRKGARPVERRKKAELDYDAWQPFAA